MNTRLKTKLLIIILGLLIVTPIVGVGCQEELEQSQSPSPSELSSTRVPNIPLDVYLYAKQSTPTTIPADIINAPQDVNIESLAVWGVPAGEDFAFGIALALTSDIEASAVYGEIELEGYGWKKLSGKTIYLVYGSGLAAESLQTAISNNNFRYYDDDESLNAAALLPDGGTIKLAAVAFAKPSKPLIDFIIKDTNIRRPAQIDLILKLANLKVVASGLYSQHQIDVGEVVEVMYGGGSISDLNLGLLVLVKSGLPGFIVEFATERFLEQSELTKTKLGELNLYKGSWDVDSGEEVHVLVRIEDNHIFVAISGLESYAETLITSIQVN